MRRALVCAAALLVGATAAFVASAVGGQAGGCPALDYQAGLVSATLALQRTPADVGAAQREVIALQTADPGSEVALQPVIGDLSTTPPAVDDAELRLSSMSVTLAYPRGSVCNENADAARSALHSVYASPDFRNLDSSSQPGLLQSIVNAIAGLLSRGAGVLGPAGAALLAVAVLVLCLLLVWRRWHRSAALRGADLDEPATAGDDPDAEWRSAQAAASRGDHREAVRRAFRAALLEVALRAHAHIDAAWTTRELLQRVDATGDVLVALAAAATLFERAWYSGVAVTQDDWTRAQERCATVRLLARAAKAPAR